MRQNYALDLAALTFEKIEDGTMRFAGVGAVSSPPAVGPAPRSSAKIGAVAAAAMVATVGGLALFAKLRKRRIDQVVLGDGHLAEVDGRRMPWLDPISPFDSSTAADPAAEVPLVTPTGEITIFGKRQKCADFWMVSPKLLYLWD